jgi:hypothetical protein
MNFLSIHKKGWFIQHWMIWKAVLNGTLQLPIMFHYSVYHQFPAMIPSIKNPKFVQEIFYSMKLHK